jgi:hypothetical protein
MTQLSGCLRKVTNILFLSFWKITLLLEGKAPEVANVLGPEEEVHL